MLYYIIKGACGLGAVDECVPLNAAVGGYLTNYMIADDPRLPNGGGDPSPRCISAAVYL